MRAYDAVHLATAWLANQEMVRTDKPPLTFFSADSRLVDVAQATGLLTANPLEEEEQSDLVRLES